MAKYNQTLAFAKANLNTNDERGKGTKDRLVIADNISYKKNGSLNKREGFSKYKEDVINNLSVFRHYDLMTIGLFDYNTMNDIGLVDELGDEYRPFRGILNTQSPSIPREISANLPLNPTKHVQFNLTDTARQDIIDNGIWDDDKMKALQVDFMYYNNFFSNGEMFNELVYSALFEESVKHIDPNIVLDGARIDFLMLILLIGPEKIFSDIIPKITDLAIRQDIEDFINESGTFLSNRETVISNTIARVKYLYEPKLLRIRDEIKEVYKMSNLFRESVLNTSYERIQPLSAFNKLNIDDKNTFIQNLDKEIGNNFPNVSDVYEYFKYNIKADGSFGDVYEDIFDIFLAEGEAIVKEKLILMIQNTISLDIYKEDWAYNDITFFSTEEANAFRNDIPHNRLNENYVLTDERTVKYEAIKNNGFNGDKVGVGKTHIDDTNTFFPSIVYFSDYDHYKDPLLNNYLSNVGLLRAEFLYATQGIDINEENLVGNLRVDIINLVPYDLFANTGRILDHIVDSSSNLVMIANTQGNGNISNIFENIITLVLPKDLDSIAVNRLAELETLKLAPYLGTPTIITGTKVVKVDFDNLDVFNESGNFLIGYDKKILSTTPKQYLAVKFKSLINFNDRTDVQTIPINALGNPAVIEGFSLEPTNKSFSGDIAIIISPKDPNNFDPKTFDFDNFDPVNDIETPGSSNPTAEFKGGYNVEVDNPLFTTNNTGLNLMLAHINDSGVPVDVSDLSTIKRIWIAVTETTVNNVVIPTTTSGYILMTDFMKRYDQDLSIKSIPQGIIKTDTLKVRQAKLKDSITAIKDQFIDSSVSSIPLSRIENIDISKLSYNISNIEDGFSAFLDDEGFIIGKNFDLTFKDLFQNTNIAIPTTNDFLYLQDKRTPNVIGFSGDAGISIKTGGYSPTISSNSKISSDIGVVDKSYILAPKFSFTIDSGNVKTQTYDIKEDIKNIIEADKNNELGIRVTRTFESLTLSSLVAFGKDSQVSAVENGIVATFNKLYNKNFKTIDEIDSYNQQITKGTSYIEDEFKCPKLEIVGDGFRVNIDVSNNDEFETSWNSATSEITNTTQSSLIFNAITRGAGSSAEQYTFIDFVNTKTGRTISKPTSITNGQLTTYVGYQDNDPVRLLEKTNEKAIKTGETFQFNFEVEKPKIFNGFEDVNSPLSKITKVVGVQQDGLRFDIPLDGSYNNNRLFTKFEVTSEFLEDIGTLDSSVEDRIPKLQISTTTKNTRSDTFDFLTDFSVNDFADITMSVWNKNLYLDSINGVQLENFSVGDIIGKLDMSGSTNVIDWVKYKNQIFITTGKKIYVLSIVKNNIITRKDLNDVNETVGDDKYYISFEEMDNVAYIPNSQEFTLYGPNVIVDDIDNDVEDSLAIPFSVDFIRINPYKGQVGKESTIKAIVSGNTQADINAYTYKWEYLDSESDGQFKEIKDDFPGDTGTALTTKEIKVVFPKDDVYTLKVTVTSGTTELAELTKYVVSNSEVDVLTPISLKNDINRCERVLVNGNTLIFYGNGTSNVYATAPENPYYFPFGNTLNISINKNEEVQCLVNLKDLVLAFTRTTISAITGSGNPAQIESLFDPYRVIQIESKVGAISKYAATNVENLAIFVSEDGVYMVKEVSVSDQRATLEQLDKGVQNIIPKDSSVNISATEKRLFIGSYVYGKLLVYDYEFSKWAVWSSANLKAQWARTIDNVYYVSNGVSILAKNALIKANEFYTYPRYYFTDDKETYAMIFQTGQSDMSVITQNFFVDGSFKFKKASEFRMKWKYNEAIKNFPTVALIGGGENINSSTNEYNNSQYSNNDKTIPKPPAILSEFRLGENNIQIENGKDNYFVYMIDKSPWFMWYSVMFLHIGDSPMELTDITTTYSIGVSPRDRNGKF